MHAFGIIYIELNLEQLILVVPYKFTDVFLYSWLFGPTLPEVAAPDSVPQPFARLGSASAGGEGSRLGAQTVWPAQKNVNVDMYRNASN